MNGDDAREAMAVGCKPTTRAVACRLITYWPARSMLTHFRRRAFEFRRNSRRASPVKLWLYLRAAQRVAMLYNVTVRLSSKLSPNQVLTHAARAAAKQLNKAAPLVAARGAREGLWHG